MKQNLNEGVTSAKGRTEAICCAKLTGCKEWEECKFFEYSFGSNYCHCASTIPGRPTDMEPGRGTALSLEPLDPTLPYGERRGEDLQVNEEINRAKQLSSYNGCFDSK